MTHRELMLKALNLKPGQKLAVSGSELMSVVKSVTRTRWLRQLAVASDVVDFLDDAKEKWDVDWERDPYCDNGYNIIGR